VPHKLVIVVRTDLEMGRGKAAAQAAHAAVTATLRTLGEPGTRTWLEEGQPKVVLRAGSPEELAEVTRRAADAGLPEVTIHDAGRTQVPGGTPTCCAVGPAEIARLDEITGDLRLL
jgi:PTH2 family peptidyl-tRNA hydrolase